MKTVYWAPKDSQREIEFHLVFLFSIDVYFSIGMNMVGNSVGSNTTCKQKKGMSSLPSWKLVTDIVHIVPGMPVLLAKSKRRLNYHYHPIICFINIGIEWSSVSELFFFFEVISRPLFRITCQLHIQFRCVWNFPFSKHKSMSRR